MTPSKGCAIAIAWIAVVSAAAAADTAAPDSDLPPGQLAFRVFAAADGLRNLVINRISQDGNGFLWVATDDGVFRFDGERFTQFSISEGLSAREVFTVGVEPGGNACVGSLRGLACWDGARFSQARTHGVPAIPVRAMVSHDGRLWVGTDGGGLYVSDSSGAFVPAPGWTGSASIPALWADDDGLVVSDGTTVQLTSGDGTWQSLGHLGAGVAPGIHDRVDGVLRDRQGALWIRTPSHLWFLPRGAVRADDLHAGLPTGFVVAGVPTGMAIGPRGDVMIGTDLGIASRDRDRWRLLGRAVGMPWASTRALFTDREGTIWIGGAGLAQLRGRGVVEHYSAPSGLAGDDVWSFQRDRHGTMWVGTNRCLARARAGRWECLPGTEGRTVRSFAFPPQGGVFVGGSPSDLLYIAPDGRVTSLVDPARSDDRSILALALGAEGDLWIGTETGLDRLPGAVPGPIEHVVVPGTHPDGRFASLLVVGDQLWTSDEQGIAVRDHGAWRLYDRRDGFPSSEMRYLVRRNDGRICVAHNEVIGVTCFRYDQGKLWALRHFGVADGLSAGVIYFLGEDHQHRLWIGTGAGVDVLTPHGVDHFDQNDGLAGDDSTANAFLADRDGSIWLGATGGATHLFAQHYHGAPVIPRTTFLDGRVGDQSILGRGPIREFPHDHNALSIEFASSSLLDPKHLEYQIRLSPMEAEWSTSPQRHARYPALPPGDYQFEVRTRIGAGRWGPTEDLEFAVLPAWWQTGRFFALIALGGIAAIGIAFAGGYRAVLRRRTRQLNARSDASFRAVIDLMPDLISVHRGPQQVYLNVAARRFIGSADQDGVQDPIGLPDRIHPDDRAQVLELFRRARNLEPQLASEVIELRVRRADGVWRTCEISAILVEIAGALTVVASGRDVTERKRMRAKLLVTDRMASLGTLAAGIAHEINNPLAYVTGNLEVLAETLQAARRAPSEAICDELASVVCDARDGAERVRKIVHGLRAFSRSKEEDQRTALRIADVLESAIRLTGNEIRHRAQLVRELGPVPLVMADDGRLTQVFINLLANAAHAIPEGHTDDNRIAVRTRTDDQGRAVIEVEDTGAGMAPEVQERVFDPFFTTKDVGEGTGLGLSICHGIISGLGGQISLDSAPGRGTLVRVVLPPHVAPTAPTPELAAPVDPGSAPDAQRRPRVMLVDDEPQVAHTMERLLRRDYDITVALCGRDAIEHITNGDRFDAIVTDVMMPNMTGIELTEEIQRVAPAQAQRLIFLSGGAFTAQTRERLDALGAPQLEKPVTAKELRACVLRMVSEAPEPTTTLL